MLVEDVVHYVPIVSSSLSTDGRFVVVSTPVYSPEKELRPVQTRILDLDGENSWEFAYPGPDVEAFYAPCIAPDSRRFVGFRFSNALLDVAIGDLENPLAAPQPLIGAPLNATALKWRGIPGNVTCLGQDDTGTKRIWIWPHSKKEATPLTPPAHSVFDYAFSASHKMLAWIEEKRTGETHAMLHVSDDHGNHGISIPLPGTPVGFLAWSPDGKRLAYMGRPEGHRLSRSEVWLVHLSDSSQEGPLITCPTQTIEGWITGFDWNLSGKALFLGVEQGTYGRIYRLELSSQKVEAIGATNSFLSGPKLDRSRGQMLFLRQDGAQPQQLCIRTRKGGKPRVLTQFNRRFEQRLRLPSETVHWESSDKLEMDGILIRPEGRGPFPTLVWVHGGPAEHINRTFSPYFQAIASRGWAVFAPNYRGSTGRDSTFLRSNIGDLCGEDVNDVLSGIRALVQRGDIDPSRVTAMGWSYGGSLCLMAAAQSDSFRALVTVAPVVDWVSIFGAQRFPAITREYFEEELWENREEYDRVSPITHSKDIQVPTLFLHGALDPLVPPSQSCLMERVMRGKGVETEFHLFPNEFHVFLRPKSIIRMLTMVLEWIEKGR